MLLERSKIFHNPLNMSHLSEKTDKSAENPISAQSAVNLPSDLVRIMELPKRVSKGDLFVFLEIPRNGRAGRKLWEALFEGDLQKKNEGEFQHLQ